MGVMGTVEEAAGARAALVDTHVHLHPQFGLDEALDHAVRNMASAAAGLGLPARSPGFLMLAETASEQIDEKLQALERGGARWAGAPLERGLTFHARREDGACLFLVRGRQVVTREKIELLALGTTGRFPDSPALDEAIGRAHDLSALPVLPWGFGKWWRGRGVRVRRSLERGPRVLPGDNGGRWRRCPDPAPLRLAARLGLPVLPGSDPLPLAGQVSRVGSYGLVLPAAPDRGAPGAWVVRSLAHPEGPVRVFGQRATLRAFLRDQAAMQLRKLGS